MAVTMDLRDRLAIPGERLDDLNALLLDPGTRVVGDLLEVVARFGTPEEINARARAAGALPALMARVREANPEHLADLEWLAGKGVSVERFNLAQQPEAFAANGQVKQALEAEGTDCLPLVLVNGVIVSKGAYPEREQLARWARLQEEAAKSIYSEAVAELVAIGASIASNCDPCFRYHFDRARKLGVSKEDMALAVKTAQTVKDTPARAVLELADRYLKERRSGAELPVVGQGGSARKSGCCS